MKATLSAPMETGADDMNIAPFGGEFFQFDELRKSLWQRAAMSLASSIMH